MFPCSWFSHTPTITFHHVMSLWYSNQEPVSRKSRKLFGPGKPFVELRPAYSVKLVFSYVVKGIKINITAMFRASRRLSFEDTKRIPSPEMRPISFGTFEKRAPDLSGLSCSKGGYHYPLDISIGFGSIHPLDIAIQALKN